MKIERPISLEGYLLDQVPAAVIATDPDGIITYWNESAAQLYAWSRADAIGRNVVDLLVPAEQRDLAGAVMRRVVEGHSWQGEMTMRRKNGSTVLVEVTDSPIVDAELGVVGVVGISVDITERRRGDLRVAAQYAISRILADATDVVGASARILRVLVDSLGFDVSTLWMLDRDRGVLRSVHTAHARDVHAPDFIAATGESTFERGVGLPGRVWDLGRPAWIADLAADSDFPRAAVAGKDGLHAALGFPVTVAGEVVGVIESFSTEVREPDHDLLQVLAVLGSQIGQFLERAEAEAALRRSEARKSAVMESALDCIISMDHEGRVVEFNPAAERTFGYAREDAIGQEMASLIIPPVLRERHRRGLARYLETGEGPILGRRFEITAMRKDGTEFPVELAITRVDLPGPPLFTGYLRDITDAKWAETERAHLLTSEQRAREGSERARRRLAFLAEASNVLSRSLNFRETLSNIGQLVVPRIADWCVLYARDESERARWIHSVHADEGYTATLSGAEAPSRHSIDALANVEQVLRSRAPTIAEIDEAQLDDPVVAALKPRSAMTLPLISGGGIRGAIAFFSSATPGYTPDDVALAEDLAQRIAQALDNARLYQERAHVARTLQKTLLPAELPAVDGMEVAARYRPAGEGNEVGGDFYDVFQTQAGDWAIVIGDVCGKGPDAAALTGSVRYTIRAAAVRGRKPSEILDVTNQAILRQVADARFCTVACAELCRDGAGAKATISCGGHPPPMILRRDGAVERAACEGTLLGVVEDPDLADVDVDLRPGDAIILYTDGVIEAREDGDTFGERRLRALLAECAGDDAEAIVDAIDRTVVEFQSGNPRDDVAILAVRVAE